MFRAASLAPRNLPAPIAYIASWISLGIIILLFYALSIIGYVNLRLQQIWKLRLVN